MAKIVHTFDSPKIMTYKDVDDMKKQMVEEFILYIRSKSPHVNEVNLTKKFTHALMSSSFIPIDILLHMIPRMVYRTIKIHREFDPPDTGVASKKTEHTRTIILHKNESTHIYPCSEECM